MIEKYDLKEELIFQKIFDFGPDAIIIVNYKGIILRNNFLAEKIFGYLEGEMNGKSVNVLIPERFRNRHDEHMKRYFENPRVRFMGSDIDLYGLKKDGTEFPVDIALSYLKTDDGLVIISTIRDITEHKRLEEKIRSSEEKYRRIFENAAEGIFQTSADRRIISANPSCVNSLGYDSEEDLISSITDVRKLYAEPGRRLQLLRNIRAEGSVSDFEAQINRKDGSKIWVSINAHTLKDLKGKVVGLEGMFIDITERKRAEKNFQKLIDGAPDAIIAVDSASRIILINEKAERLFGYSKLELLGSSYNILIPERFRVRHAEYCKPYSSDPLEKMMAKHSRTVARYRDGSEIPIEVNMSPVETDYGIVIVIDIREDLEKK